MREIVARAFDEYMRRKKLSPRRVGERLAELGYHGRGGEVYTESSARGWRSGEYAPPATVMVALILDAEISFDELAYGSGLRAEVDRLRESTDTGNRELARLQRDVAMLAGVVTRHLTLDPDAAQDVGRIGRRDEEPV